MFFMMGAGNAFLPRVPRGEKLPWQGLGQRPNMHGIKNGYSFVTSQKSAWFVPTIVPLCVVQYK